MVNDKQTNSPVLNYNKFREASSMVMPQEFKMSNQLKWNNESLKRMMNHMRLQLDYIV